jgi:Fe-Mn family superoxide dismutase
MAFSVPDLPYPFDSLEPYIDAKTMEIHHDKHHGTYVTKLNAALEKAPNLQGKSIEEVIRAIETLPQEIRTAVRNHGGGHYNHTLFWKMMKPQGGGKPSGSLLNAIEVGFNGFDAFKDQFSNAAANHFGSGWAWLAVDGSKKLVVVTTANQDPVIMQGLKPVLGLDVWEHAYYLKYQNRRPEYIAAFWNVVNWEQVSENLKDAMK